MLSENIKNLRKAKGISQEELAIRQDERRMREAPRRDDRKEESRNSRDEEKGKSGINARKADGNNRQPSKFESQ